ncbi:hypothetical protein [Kiloniella sp. b19]|uniref:hypothetical protein n=1 Tax=Kiloniella sp. GXU_MW_B19 TaxID=3141326 RepID=UPI0031D934E7
MSSLINRAERHPLVSTAAFFLVALLLLGLVQFTAPSRKGQAVALVFPFHHHSEETFASVINAGGYVLRHGRFENVVIGVFDTIEPERIADATGALFVVEVDRIASCLGRLT